MARGYGAAGLAFVLCGCFIDSAASPDGVSESAASESEPSTTGASGDSQGSGSSSGGTTGCGPSEACLPEAGDAWRGPVLVVIDDEGPPVCVVASTELWRGGLDPNTPDCDCSSCGAADVSCTATIGSDSDGDCAFEEQERIEFRVSPGVSPCVRADRDFALADAVVTADPGPSPTCEPPMPPQGGFRRYAVACEILPGGSCEGGVCAAQPPSPAVETCLWQRGVHECPPGLDRTVYFTGLSGEVSCDACECQAEPGAACDSAQLTWFSGSACTDPVEGSVDLVGGECVSVEHPSGAEWLQVTVDFSEACTSRVGSAPALGRYEGADPITACCA